MKAPTCKNCSHDLTSIPIDAPDGPGEAAGPDLVWGCANCHNRYDVYLTDEPSKYDDVVVCFKGAYFGETIHD
jgi:hypothetical protein